LTLAGRPGTLEALSQLRKRHILSVAKQIRTKVAEAAYENAKLAREVAEIAVTEYDQRIFVQAEATAEGEVRLAQNHVSQKSILFDRLKEQLARIRRTSNGSAMDLTIEFQCSDRVIDAQRREQKARLEAENAESSLRMLIDYAQPIRLRELRAEVEMARSDELAKRATFEVETAEQERLAAAAADESQSRRSIGFAGTLGRRFGPSPPSEDDRILALLDNAISVEEQLRAKLNHVKTQENVGLLLQKEIRELTRQLQAIVEEAEAEQSSLQFDHLKARMNRAASQAGVPAK
jgi:hypothetical protein